MKLSTFWNLFAGFRQKQRVRICKVLLGVTPSMFHRTAIYLRECVKTKNPPLRWIVNWIHEQHGPDAWIIFYQWLLKKTNLKWLLTNRWPWQLWIDAKLLCKVCTAEPPISDGKLSSEFNFNSNHFTFPLRWTTSYFNGRLEQWFTTYRL